MVGLKLLLVLFFQTSSVTSTLHHPPRSVFVHHQDSSNDAVRVPDSMGAAHPTEHLPR